MVLEGSIVNQIEISGFTDEKKAVKFRKKIKSIKSIFNLSRIDKSISFAAEEASWKLKDDFSLVYLFLTEDFYPEEEIAALSSSLEELSVRHLVLSPSGEGLVLYFHYGNGVLEEKTEVKGDAAHMLGDLVKGGFH